MQQPDNKSATRPQQIAILVTLAIEPLSPSCGSLTSGCKQSKVKSSSPCQSRPAHMSFTALAILLRFLRWHYALASVAHQNPHPRKFDHLPLRLGDDRHPTLHRRDHQSVLAQRPFRRETPRDLNPRRLGTAVGCNRRFIFVRPLTSSVTLQQLAFIVVIIISLVSAILIIRRYVTSPALIRLFHPSPLLICFLISLASWTFASATLYAVAESNLNFIQSIQLYSSSTLLGALSLVPAGLGVTGSTLIYQLQEAGLPTQKAVAAVIVLRSLTVWASVIVGSLSLYYGVRYWGWFRKLSSINHFDDIADEYEETIPLHIRARLLDRKLAPIIHELRNSDRAAMIGLDLGSGQGWYLQKMLGGDLKWWGQMRRGGQLAAASEIDPGKPSHADHGSLRCPRAAIRFRLIRLRLLHQHDASY